MAFDSSSAFNRPGSWKRLCFVFYFSFFLNVKLEKSVINWWERAKRNPIFELYTVHALLSSFV